jgi:hypothetical protein
MLFLSYIVLAIASLFAALLPYRQPKSLTEQSSVIASLLVLCCLFIFLSTVLPLFIGQTSNDNTLVLMLENLHRYLALPLLTSVVLAISLDKHFKKGTWGRWSLVLLASFELCRRAEVGDMYSFSLALICGLLITFSVIYCKRDVISDNLVIKLAAVICYLSALWLFSNDALIVTFENTLVSSIYYNLTLAVSLVLICFIAGKRLTTVHE